MTSIDVQHPADFPPEFIKAFQSGKLVFFCGAGVSNYGDKVPKHYHSFKDLAKAVLDKFNPSWETGEQSIKYKWFQQELFDQLHKVLEDRYGSVVDDIDIKELLQEKSPNYDELLEFLANKHHHDVVDKYIKNLFQENLPELEPTQHQTLINLAKQNPSGHIKIVTTNFDTLFTKALAGDDTIREFYAPRLPIPRSPKDYPSSITYLHGGVDKQNPEPKWVYSTSEFGKAYVADGWASRFITELARNYYICFIGYSMNDPIMRYIFAGIKAVNEEHPDNVSKPLYIFQEQKNSEPKSPYEEEEEYQDLENLGLIPISFPKSFPKFTKMWQMLNEWHELQNRDIIELCQEAFKDFDESKETLTDLQRYVLQNLIPPADLYVNEKNPLTNESYHRIQYHSDLAKNIETLPFDLLKAIHMVDSIQYRKQDERTKLPNVDYAKIYALPNLIHPDFNPDFNPKKRNLSVYGHFISPVEIRLHPISEVLIRLIGKHLNNPSVFLWLVQQDDFLHSSLISELERRLRLDTESLIPTNLKEAWELLLLNQSLRPRMASDLFIDEKMKNQGYSLEVKLWLEKALSPYLKFYPPYSFGSDSSLYRAEIIIGDSHQKYQIDGLLKTTDLQFYRDLLGILESRLATYIELTKKIPSSLAGEHYEFNWEITSILDHSQNHEFDRRPILIPLFQRCFEKLHKTDKALCNQILARWASKPEWLWHRMVLAYVTQYSDVLDPAPAWQVLRQNDYIVIQKSCRIKKEFFDYIEKEGLTLPDDILEVIYTKLRLTHEENNEYTWYDDEKGDVLKALNNKTELSLPDDLETLYQQLLSEGYSRESESYKFSHYSTGFQQVPPSDVSHMKDASLDSAVGYFADSKNDYDTPNEFEAYVKENPKKGYQIFLGLLEKDEQEKKKYSELYLRSLAWGLSSYYDKEFDAQKIEDLEERKTALEKERQERTTVLFEIYKTLFSEDIQRKLHELDAVLYSVTRFLKDAFIQLVTSHSESTWALFSLVWESAKQFAHINEMKRQDYSTQVLNQPMGQLLEALLKLEYHRSGKYTVEPKKEEDETKKQNNAFTLLSETQHYLDDLMQIPNVEYTYSMLGAYLAFLFQVHQDWTQTHLFPLLQVNASHPDFQKGKALVEGLVGYGNFTLPLFNDLADSLRNLDCQAYFKAEDRQLFINYASTMLSTYFVHPATPTDLRKITAVELHAWLKQMPVENLSLVAETVKDSIVLNDESFESQLKPFFEIAWTKEKNRRTAEHTGIFIELALDNPRYCKRIADLLRRENLVIRTEAGYDRLSFLWRFEEHLNAFDQENFTAFCELLCDYLPDHCQYESHILKQFKMDVQSQSRLSIPPCLAQYLNRL